MYGSWSEGGKWTDKKLLGNLSAKLDRVFSIKSLLDSLICEILPRMMIYSLPKFFLIFLVNSEA